MVIFMTSIALSRTHHKLYHVTSPAPRDLWQEMAAADPLGLVSQTPAWIDTICATGHYCDASRLYEMADGRQIILPLVREAGRPAFLATAASFPAAWGMGGVVSRTPVTVADLALIFADLQQSALLRILVRPNPLTNELWAAAAPAGVIKTTRCAHVLDLSSGFDHIWTKRFDSNTRNKVRKGERSGLVVECDTTGRLAPVFYGLLEQSFERWGEQQHEPRWLARWRGHQRDPLSKFETMSQRLGTACRIWVAWANGEPAAAIVVVQGANAHYTRGAMNKALAGPTNANYLLQRVAIEDACQAGCRAYHMGESGTSAALAHFKSRFGAVEVPYADYRLEKLPITRWDQQMRGVVKRLIGFRDVPDQAPSAPTTASAAENG